MKRKLLLISIGVVLGVGVSIAIPRHQPPVNHQVLLESPTAQVEQKPAPQTKSTVAPVINPEVPAPQKTPQLQTSQPASSAVNTQPDFGQNPTNPNLYTVFNKTKIMDEAGIPTSEQPEADTLVTDLTDWNYEATGMPADLCYIMPMIKMSSAGTDYATNPVTQLSYCNQLAQARYGGWEQALAAYQAHPSYGFFD